MEASASRFRSTLAVCAPLTICWIAYLAIYLPLMMDDHGHVAGDYSYFLPRLLGGYYWQHNNGLFSVPWFTPAFCGGLPEFANPQSMDWSLPQLLTLVVNPWHAVLATVAIESAIGLAGMFVLMRGPFGASLEAATLGAAMFLFNSFFAHRMIEGHFAFHPFVLMPWTAYLLLADAKSAFSSLARACGAAITLAMMVYGGMSVALPPVAIALAALMVIHGMQRRSAVRMFIASVLAFALCAFRIEATASFVANVKRDFYELPGFSNPFALIWIAFKQLFLFGSPADWNGLTIQGFTLGSAERQYCVGPVALALIAGAAMMNRLKYSSTRVHTHLAQDERGGYTPLWKCVESRASTVFLAGLLLIPLMVNFRAPGWSELLKAMPVIKNSSSLIRWFAAYIPVIVVAASLSLDRLGLKDSLRRSIALAGILATIGWHVAMDRSNDNMIYNPTHIDNAWTAARNTGGIPSIALVDLERGGDGKPIRKLDSDDMLALGVTPAACYEPLFGYYRETFPLGRLRGKPIDSVVDGRMNMKNPACYLYPSENGCQPGDEFTGSQRDTALALASYRPMEFRVPLRQQIAGVVSAIAFLTVIALISAALIRRAQ